MFSASLRPFLNASTASGDFDVIEISAACFPELEAADLPDAFCEGGASKAPHATSAVTTNGAFLMVRLLIVVGSSPGEPRESDGRIVSRPARAARKRLASPRRAAGREEGYHLSSK